MILPGGAILLDMPFLPRSSGRCRSTCPGGWKFWVFLLVPALLQTLIVEATVIQGQEIMGLLPNVFQVQSTNGFVWWFFLSALIAIAFFAVRMFVDKTIDRGEALARMRTTPVNLGKAILFGAATISVPYLFALLGAGLTGGWYGRVFRRILRRSPPTVFR